jgi:hypothetical protein
MKKSHHTPNLVIVPLNPNDEEGIRIALGRILSRLEEHDEQLAEAGATGPLVRQMPLVIPPHEAHILHHYLRGAGFETIPLQEESFLNVASVN